MQVITRAKEAAKGSERGILISVAGAQQDWLDGKGRPCPKCGGNDRFSYEEKNASFLCRKCFSSGSNPDVVGSVAWMLDIEQTEAAKKILAHLGIDPSDAPAKKSRIKYTFKAIKLQDNYSSQLGQMWCASNPPIVDSAIGDSGAKFGKWFNNDVLAFPVHGPKRKRSEFGSENQEVVAYTMYTTMQGSQYCKIRIKAKGQPDRFERSITVAKRDDSSPSVGIIGPWQRMAAADNILKVEGTTDMLAANSMLPDGWVAVSNSSGAGATPPEWFCQLFKDKRVFIIHDNDDAGDKGAKKWIQKAAKHTKLVCNPRLPEAGMDLRDFLREKTSEQFLAWLENSSGVIEPERDETGEIVDDDELNESMKKCLADLTLDVLYEDENHVIQAYCHSTKKTIPIRQVHRLHHEDMIQYCGERAITYIASDPEPHQYSMTKVKHAISLQSFEEETSQRISRAFRHRSVAERRRA